MNTVTRRRKKKKEKKIIYIYISLILTTVVLVWVSWGFAEQEQDSEVAENERRNGKEEKWKGGPVRGVQDKGREGKKEEILENEDGKKKNHKRESRSSSSLGFDHTQTLQSSGPRPRKVVGEGGKLKGVHWWVWWSGFPFMPCDFWGFQVEVEDSMVVWWQQ